MAENDRALTAAIFPSAGSAHVWHAQDAGMFEATGLDVEVVEVRSSDEQMRRWDDGEVAVMHTSPDHLLRPRRREPVALRPEGLGEIVVHARPEIRDIGGARWGVDGPDSAFALVLRAVLEHAGIAVDPADLVPVGGTIQRFHALLEGRIDGTALHAPFDRGAEHQGFPRVGGHLDVVPDLTTVVVVAARREAHSANIQDYLAALDHARNELLAGGAPAVSDVLLRRGWEEGAARSGGERMVAPGGLRQDPDSLSAGLRAAVALRRRFEPEWLPDRDVADLIAES